LRFAQVREDALQDIAVVESLGAGARVMMVASGGCTAAALAGAGKVARLHLVDPNPAQIALSRLKLRLLQFAAAAERRAILGHAPMEPSARGLRLKEELGALDLPAEILGPRDFIAELGPDHAGRYERLFAQLRFALADVFGELTGVLEMRDPAGQARRVAPGTRLGEVLDAALDAVMALPNLVALFGADATKNPAQTFSRHFAQRIRHGFATFPAATNPYLWQMLRGTFPPGIVSPWLSAPAPAQMPEVSWSINFMDQALGATKPGEFDYVHLSNVLDWLAPAEARSTLEHAWTVLRPGGVVVIRQLNSTLEIQALSSRFAWDAAAADRLHAADRSFFYRQLHLGRKR
jgi:S-adenosylmethionine-diacylglycerol 3-amino-3-carboxypropyl transferase